MSAFTPSPSSRNSPVNEEPFTMPKSPPEAMLEDMAHSSEPSQPSSSDTNEPFPSREQKEEDDRTPIPSRQAQDFAMSNASDAYDGSAEEKPFTPVRKRKRSTSVEIKSEPDLFCHDGPSTVVDLTSDEDHIKEKDEAGYAIDLTEIDATVDLTIDSDTLQQPHKEKKPRQKPATNAREAFSRRYDDSNKPKPTALGTKKPFKKSNRRKSSKHGVQGAVTGTSILNQLAGMSHITGANSRNGDRIAPTISASTKQTQIKQLLDGLPQNADQRKSRGDVTALKKASESFGKGQIKAVDGKWRLTTMKTPLMSHQLIGVSWMLNREFSFDFPEGPFGGICADGMGFGKTIEIIATIIANPGPGGTLIVVPKTVLYQWADEIDKHKGPEHFQRVLMYEKKSRTPRILIEDCDIVLTTWDELMNSCPFPNKSTFKALTQRSRTRKDRPEDYESSPVVEWIKEHIHEAGDLHQIDWRRIVLDEAHIMMNHLSRKSFAANALEGKYRWALSGTPIMNRLEEFYPYFRFLRDPAATPSYRMFKRTYCNFKDPQCNEKLDAALAKNMFRRTNDDLFLGRPILDLPTPVEAPRRITFGPQEEILYRAVEDRFRALLNEFFADDDERKKLTYFLPQLTRLRQMTTHPLLIERQIMLTFDDQDLKRLLKDLRKVSSSDSPLYKRVSRWAERKRSGLLESDDSRTDENYHDCLICGDIAESPYYINLKNCQHIFCKQCIEADLEIQIAGGEDETVCPECRLPFDDSVLKVFNPSKQSSVKGSAKAQPSKKKVAQKGKDVMMFQPYTHNSEWLDMYDNGEAELFYSAKLEGLRNQIRTWLREAPDEKLIIFTQWRQFAVIVGRVLERERIQFVYFTGCMSSEERDLAVRKFEKIPEVSIMVSSLKCGSLGLNLAVATRVISVDLWWNAAVEAQAFGRVYRLPQKKTTYFTRLIVAKSVDERLEKMQRKKSHMIGETMSTKLSTEEMAGLFGRVTRNELGRIVVVRDYDDEDEVLADDLDSDIEMSSDSSSTS